MIPDEGFVNVKGGEVWYKIYGKEKNKIPLLLVPGGPGFPSDYLNPLMKISSDRPVIFYDQLGSGRSDIPTDTTLWVLSRLVDEIAILRKELGLDQIHVFCHSVGTMVVSEYLVTIPKGIKSIVFAGPISNTDKYLKSVNELKMNLPAPIRDTLVFHENKGTVYSEPFQEAYLEFINLHWCRTLPYPKEIEKAFSYPSSGASKTMWGDFEFYCTGNLKDFNRESILKEINVPTLFTCGRYDLTTPERTKEYAEQVEGAELVVFENSAHMTMNEEPELYTNVIRKFLNKNE
jgi:proline iminopeptidase